MPSQAEFTRKGGGGIRAAFQEAPILNTYNRKGYSEYSWSNIIHQQFEIKIALSLAVKDIRTEISKDKHFQHVIQEWSNTNQWGIYPLNYSHKRKRVHIFQATPIGELPVEITNFF